MRWTEQGTERVISQNPPPTPSEEQTLFVAPTHTSQSGRAELWGGRDPAQDLVKEATQKFITPGRPAVAWGHLWFCQLQPTDRGLQQALPGAQQAPSTVSE